ncbi:hypothetical protein DSCO28_04760 [Desulfosarcina ovata subsp. sediminis]|uniref:ABC transporter permease n=1 Tax=Desulfosarcina ovata subsp. sediminis TaxID=885957 RepID=A0A5K7ZN08_9BACT|nr:ABC transporter permease [Desulfosarcina ovata]BBO79910.1 hypothetical protein DSCO28_04760 [Desulfosarcina ovata subsp. sediminis]
MGIAAGLLAGSIIGFFNGYCVAILEINPFIVTLGTYNILLAVSSTVTGGFPVTGLPTIFPKLFSEISIIGIPIAVIIAVLIIVTLEYLLLNTVFGRNLYLIGSNPRAAHIAGISYKFNSIVAYILCSFLIAIGAILLTARTGSGEPNLGSQLTLQTIAAAVIGGMSLRGGEGSMMAPVLGALFVTVLSNGMNLTRIDGYMQEISLGVLIISILGFDRFRNRR